MALIEIEHPRKEYPNVTGKSTMLRCLNGLETPTSGLIRFNGQNREHAL